MIIHMVGSLTHRMGPVSQSAESSYHTVPSDTPLLERDHLQSVVVSDMQL